MPPKVTINILSYNQEKFIAQALESFVMQQTNFPFEVVIGDDASTDNTAKIITEYANKYPAIIKPIFQEKNIGILQNWYSTLKDIKSDYIIYCDGDDYFTDPLKLQMQADFLDAHPDYAICFHPVRVFFEDGSKPDEIYPSPKIRFGKTTLELSDLLKTNFIQTNSCMYRWRFNTEKENVKDFFPEDIMPGDYYLHLLHAQKGKIGFIDRVMADYRRHKDGIWWESAKSPEALHLKHGTKEISFYSNVYKNITNSCENYFTEVFRPSFLNIFNIYLENKKFEEIKVIIENNAENIIKLCTAGKYDSRAVKKLKKYKKLNLFLIITSAILLILLMLILILIYR